MESDRLPKFHSKNQPTQHCVLDVKCKNKCGMQRANECSAFFIINQSWKKLEEEEEYKNGRDTIVENLISKVSRNVPTKCVCTRVCLFNEIEIVFIITLEF